jgi:hypothetical protein
MKAVERFDPAEMVSSFVGPNCSSQICLPWVSCLNVGERQKVGGPVSAALGRTARRIPRKINRLKSTVADLPRLRHSTPDFLVLSLRCLELRATPR